MDSLTNLFGKGLKPTFPPFRNPKSRKHPFPGMASLSKSLLRLALAAIGISGVLTDPSVAEPPRSSTVEHGHGYLLACPGKPTRKRPLLVSLHGTDGSPEKALTAWSRAAIEAEVYLLCPAPAGKNWQIEPDTSRILGLIHLATEKHAIDPRRVYLTGFSSGATFAGILGTSEPSVFGALTLTSGHLSGTVDRATRDPAAPAIHIVHGEQDEAFPIRAARKSVARFRRLGYTVSYTEVPDMSHDYPSTDLTRRLLAWMLCFPKISLPDRPQP